jgi:hypothetical protein
MARLSAERFLPPHHLDATTAYEAYRFSDIASRADWKHLEVSYLLKAARDPNHLEILRAGHAYSRKIDSFVDLMLSELQGRGLIDGENDEALTAACRWLALFNTARKVLRIQAGITISIKSEGDSVSEGLQGALCLHCCWC